MPVRFQGLRRCAVPASTALAVVACALATALPAAAQNYPVTPTQRAVAQATAESGVPESELTPNAPDIYTVKRGDTLWAVSGLYLRKPWRWPELWGMNLAEIRNPHLIYPGQQLYLERSGGRARLRTSPPGYGDAGTVRMEPRTRIDRVGENPLPTLRPSAIEPFLAEPLVIDAPTLGGAPRLVGTQEDRVMLARGDRAYARGPSGQPMAVVPGQSRNWRVFRDAVPLRDPSTGEILGFEAQYLGRAELVRGETVENSLRDGKELQEVVPATVDITATKEEMRVGDRLLPEPPTPTTVYVPRAPTVALNGARVASIYGSAVLDAAQNQVVTINRGTRDGIEPGFVMAILSEGDRIIDKTDPQRARIKLPDERNGLLMVFRSFDRVSYGLILSIRTGVKVGDRLVSPE
ncbi:LysM peptidoglycan-binding domain-containing protein [Xylophilus sp. GOD-11R]|uniref:LysM peptidoglycan-binding domain-containing protein n=1 Tax=Xylophilus sp. GOD-11R TaxID=3089814 RepID=UPI00298D0DB5|nr:LysM peptidoglycan-binding domain-containing protein [Xylophilus sp. GOD-11R]WPB57181.1 LysM peptidoglycan-binding domain-containing protein [Xylophilus sp. GOD-11R]